ncbi:MAG: selenite/tellurite reduction operon b-type cytochrome iron-sulfur cluster-binding subunit ExtO [Thermodesulfobacteriota bacterium]|nr:selenite/tellurite reduction operon b-type cytochrome iron-sulfur cluster-binding subunit ExtO [Thermodesulfobacteriota bacterium]
MIRLKNALIALLVSGSCVTAHAAHTQLKMATPCQNCHDSVVVGAHATLLCQDCHGADGDLFEPTTIDNKAHGCSGCHKQAEHIFDHAMSTREAEQQFCQRSWSQADPQFFERNCMGCHVTRCLDCHGEGHAINLPDVETCVSCHNGYFVGWDYSSRAPREDSVRYQRGGQNHGQYFLKMRPDVHFEVGMDCSDCHTMTSLQEGKIVARRCVDCHDPDPQVIEHSIDAHMYKLECVSCHAAWAAQEYGSFYIQTRNSSNRDYFRVKPVSDQYVKSAYLKRQDVPPLGLNERGLVAPIRPQFIAYYSEMKNNQPVGEENRLLAAQWKAFTPHTIRRGTVMCDGCHGNARRFMLEPLSRRIYRPDMDGLGLESFWRSVGQTVVNGAFYSPDQFTRMSQKTTEYKRKYVEKWQNFLKKDADSSAN